MFDLPSVLPPNRTELETALEQAVRTTAPDLAPVSTLMNPDTCPADLLGWLAWAFSVDVWDPDWDEATKREVIRSSPAVHRRKGSKASVRSALDIVFPGAAVSEWFQHGGDPFTFRVQISGAVHGSRSIAKAESIIRNNKPVRAHLDFIEVHSPTNNQMHMGHAVQTRTTQTIPANFPEIPAPLLFAMGIHTATTQTIEAHPNG